MGKPKAAKKKSDAANRKANGSHKKDNPVSKKKDQESKGSMPPQDPGGKSGAPSQSGKTESEGGIPPAPNADKPSVDTEKPQGATKSGKDSPPAKPTQGKGELSDEEIEDIVQAINRKLGTNVDKARLEVGKFVLKKVFDGSLKDALSHSPKKDTSFEKIIKHSDLAVDATTLSRWVRAADLSRWFEENIKDRKFRSLTTSHLIALLKVRNERETLLRLVAEVDDEKLSVRALRRAIDARKADRGIAGSP